MFPLESFKLKYFKLNKIYNFPVLIGDQNEREKCPC